MSWLLPVLVGLAAGVLSGLGVGGGTLLLLWLTQIEGLPQAQAGGVNLLYFLLCALPAFWGHWRRGLVDRRALTATVLWGLPACVAGALLAQWMESPLLGRLFGLLLAGVGLRELFFPPKKGSAHNPSSPGNTRERTDNTGAKGGSP